MYAHLTEEQTDQTARMIWREINGKNLVENIEPTKTRASLVVEKGRDHRVTNVRLRRL
jgi:type I pantothenate kinase